MVILLAVIPLGAIASMLAWGNYQAVNVRGAQRAEAALLRFIADQQEAVGEATGTLTALARMPGIAAPATCPMLASLALRLSPDRLLGLAVRAGTAGEPLVCASGASTPAPMGSITASWANGGLLGRIERAGPTRAFMPLRVIGPAVGARGAVIIDALIAIARTPPFGGRDHENDGGIWLLRNGSADLLAGVPGAARPDWAVLRHLAAGDRPVFATDAAGRMHAFAAGRLPDGSVVIAGDRATDEEQRAALLLFRRVLAIAALLTLGLVVVVIGAHVTVSAPVAALTRRVDRWRERGTFDSAGMRFMPSELLALASVFAHAVEAIGEREQALERAAAEQELLIKEIHHRVKNNLQIVASLLNLQASRIRAPEAKAEFGAARDRVRALATLHRHLYSEGGLHTIAMRPFLLELCGQLFQAMGEREGTRIRLEVEAPELDMSSDQAVPLALIVTEAVSNAVKYAFPGGRSGHISVRLTRGAASTIELAIEDDGVGIPAGRADTETGIRDGLGIQLIRGFARQLGATLTVTEDHGTRYDIVLKINAGERCGDPGAAPAAA